MILLICSDNKIYLSKNEYDYEESKHLNYSFAWAYI